MAKKKEQIEATEPLSEQEVWDVIEYARSLYSSSVYPQYLTPDLISARMRDITMNPMAALQTDLDTALADPKNNEVNLQRFSQSFEITSMLYKKIISYLSNMLSFDLTYTSNAKPEQYNTPKYKKDMEALETFLDKFEYKEAFRIAVREMLRNDAFFGCFRDVGDKYVIQELPSEYCKITGRWAGGFLFSFNMYWFMQSGTNIDGYSDFFKKKFNDMFRKGKNGKYNPSLPPETRGSTFMYWVDIPVTEGVCFKLSPELATRLPYFTPLFSDLILQGQMRNLQKNASMAAASRMIVGEVPMLNRDIKATVKDSIAISPDLLGKFMALVKSAMSESIKMASAPLQNMKAIAFEAENEIYDSYLKTTYATTGLNTNLIFTSNIKPNAIETQLSLNVDEQMMTALYEQFEDFMNYYINNKIARTYKFSLVFEGTDFFLNRQKRFDDAMSLFDKGIVLPQKIASSLGMKPHELRRQMEESNAFKFMDMLTPPSLAQQKELLDIQNQQAEKMADKQAEHADKMVDKQAENAENQIKIQSELAPKAPKAGATKEAPKDKGRPKKKESELGDSGLETRDAGSNVGRGGKP